MCMKYSWSHRFKGKDWESVWCSWLSSLLPRYGLSNSAFLYWLMSTCFFTFVALLIVWWFLFFFSESDECYRADCSNIQCVGKDFLHEKARVRGNLLEYDLVPCNNSDRNFCKCLIGSKYFNFFLNSVKDISLDLIEIVFKHLKISFIFIQIQNIKHLTIRN